MTTVAIIQARMGSSRLPGKVLMDLAGRSVLAHVVEAANLIAGVDVVVVATSSQIGDDALAAWCDDHDVACFRGSETDVLDRFVGAACAHDASIVIRLTADCPLLDPEIAGQVLALLIAGGVDYASNIDPASWPDGLDCEAMTMAALVSAAADATRSSDREHVTPFIRNSKERYTSLNLICPIPGLGRHRWTLDTADDFTFLANLMDELPGDRAVSMTAVLALLRSRPELGRTKQDARNAGFSAARGQEVVAAQRSFEASHRMLARAEAVIPLGSQTFSKSRLQLPPGEAPLFLTHGDGGRVWDIDGNEYVDMVSGLLPVVLGYRDPEVDWAVRRQLDRGISFSLATKLESDLAERLVRLVPSAEMVRFGKNGTDATSACIRLSRAFTGRDRIALCGYHGWQDWYVGATTRNRGIPQAVSELSHMVAYGDLEAVDRLMSQHRGEFACLIIEPTNIVDPPEGYLEALRQLVHRHGALLVFDEVITGFRWALGGAQAHFGVTPDLSAFGKAMANGLPISAVVGRADVMAEMEQIFFSSTFGGEAISLAGAIATVDKLERENVPEILWRKGAELMAETRAIVTRHGLDDTLDLVGSAPWAVLSYRDHVGGSAAAVKTLFLREMIAAGVLINASHNVSFAHNRADMAQVQSAWEHAAGVLALELARGDLDKRLHNGLIRPVFQVRPSA
ncbi:MAG: hypothetical protein CMM46_01840 [Rhodospirillaceae bacterium]|nr:hypothetical protein [Rhodospirillaceae bacterium]|tara:strand:- start:9683 stop:11734 length:2052 start_codon:yes stop_codon:yes gene_type:complete